MKPTGKLVVMAGPSAVGKGTLASYIVSNFEGFVLSVSATTRSPREGEVDGISYVFLDEEEFKARADSGQMLEWATVHGKHSYGTPRGPVEQGLAGGSNVILEIDVQGAAQVLERVPDCLFILLEPPSAEVQAERLRGRGDPPEQAERRIAVAQAELAEGRRLGAVCIVNDDLDRTVAEVEGLIAEHRSV